MHDNTRAERNRKRMDPRSETSAIRRRRRLEAVQLSQGRPIPMQTIITLAHHSLTDTTNRNCDNNEAACCVNKVAIVL